jgi:hypothetical protein
MKSEKFIPVTVLKVKTAFPVTTMSQNGKKQGAMTLSLPTFSIRTRMTIIMLSFLLR